MNSKHQPSDNNAEVKAIMNSKHDTSENTELRGDPSITHQRNTEVRDILDSKHQEQIKYKR
jgi:hypothetical protein